MEVIVTFVFTCSINVINSCVVIFKGISSSNLHLKGTETLTQTVFCTLEEPWSFSTTIGLKTESWTVALYRKVCFSKQQDKIKE